MKYAHKRFAQDQDTHLGDASHWLAPLPSRTPALVASLVALVWFLSYPFSVGCAALGSPYRRSDASLFDYAAWFRAFIDPDGGDLGQIIPPSPYLAALTFAYRLTGPWCYTPYVLNALLLAIGAGLVYRLTQALFGRDRTAVIATGLYVLSPGLIFQVGLPMKAAMEAPLVLTALYALACGLRTPALWRAAVLSAAVGLLALERNHALPALLALPALALLQKSIARRLGMLAAATIPAAIILAASAAVTPAATTSPLGLNFYIGNAAGASGSIVPIPGIRDDLIGHHRPSAQSPFVTPGSAPVDSRTSLPWIVQALREHTGAPWGVVALQVKKLGILMARQAPGSPELAAVFRPERVHLRIAFIDFGLILALAIPGLILAWRHWQATPVWRVFVIAPLVYALIVVAFFVIERYRLPLLCMLIPFAAYAVERCVARRPGWPRIAVAALAVYALSIGLESRNPVGPGWPDDITRAHHQADRGLALAAERRQWRHEALVDDDPAAWQRLSEYADTLGLAGDAAVFNRRTQAARGGTTPRGPST